jgi:predicted ATPase/Tfp pilus assembly protein PilF
MSSFGMLLRRHRNAAGLTQEALAERAGVSVRTIAGIESHRGGPPRGATLALLADALQLADANRAAFLAAGRQDVPRTSALVPRPLPVWPTDLIGRAHECATLITLLQSPAHRLVTVTGTAGVGKTSVALAAMQSPGTAYPDGIFLIWLAGLRAPVDLAAILLPILGISEQGKEGSRSRLVAALQEQQVLLVFDNAEHLPDLPAFVAELLAQCASLHVLATSRRPLRIGGEYEMPLAPLPVPAAPDIFDTHAPFNPIANLCDPAAQAASLANPSVALFVARAQMSDPTFAWTEQNAATIATICRKLDGLPLALELAAGCLRLMTLEELAQQLDHRLTVLVHGRQDGPRHHLTLQDAIAWSYRLLTPTEACVLRRLARFVGGCPLDEISEWLHHLAGADDDIPGPAQSETAFAAVMTLAEHHLIQRSPDATGSTRLTLLDTIREYVWEQVQIHHETEAIARLHADYAIALAERAGPHLWGQEQRTWAERLDADYPNLVLALNWAIPHWPEGGLRLATRLFRYWYMRGMLSEGRRYLAWALEAVPPTDCALYAKALNGAGLLAFRQGDFKQANVWLMECLDHLRMLGDPRGLGGVLNNLAMVALEQNRYADAQRFHEEGLALHQAQGHLHDIPISLNNLGNVLRMQGEYVRAAECYAEALALQREQGDTNGIARVLGNLGVLAWVQGDIAQAQTYYEQALALNRELGNAHEIAASLLNLSEVAYQAGDFVQGEALCQESLDRFRTIGDTAKIAAALTYQGNGRAHFARWEEAQTAYEEALALFADIGYPRYTYKCLLGLAATYIHYEATDRALGMLSIVHHWREQMHFVLEAAEARLYDEVLQSTRIALAPDAWQQVWHRGQTLDLDALLLGNDLC